MLLLLDNPVRVTDFIQEEWSANVAIIPLSGSADGWKGPRAARTEGKESLGNERRRPKTKTKREENEARGDHPVLKREHRGGRGEVECPNNIIQRAPRKGRMYCRHPGS